MPSGFPGSIDNFTDPLTTSPLNSPSHAGQHQDLNDAVEKIETFVLNLPRGFVSTTSGGTNSLGYITGLAAQTVNAGNTADVTNSSMTFTGVSGRLYEYFATGEAGNTSASGLATLTITDASNNVLQRAYINMTNSAGGGMFAIRYVFTATTSVTLKMRLQANTGNTTIFQAASLGAITLRDIGRTT